MATVALLIAIEDHADERIRPVPYAAADLAEFSAVLTQLGFPEAHQVRRLNGEALRSVLEADLESALRGLSPDDMFVLYYVGHGFAADQENYLTCHDTQLDDPAGTSLSLSSLFRKLRASPCRRIGLFLDAGHGGLSPDNLATPAIVADWNDQELETFFATASNCVCFTACSSGEISHRSSHHKRGIWAYHVAEALRAETPSTVPFVTAASLQHYLLQAVPRTLRSEYTTPKRQTPRVFGDWTGESPSGSLSSLFARPRPAAASLPRLATIVISSCTREPIKALAGFKKSHRVPDRKNSAADDFLVQISEPELQKDLDTTFQNLKSIYRFKRLELERRGPSGGGGVVITPHFEYSISVELAADDTSKIIWRRQVRKITDPGKVFCAEFDCVFSAVFDTIEIGAGQSLNVANVIDRIEELDSPDIGVSYDADCTECTINLTGSQVAIRVTELGLFIQDRQTTSPRKLLESAMDAQYRLTHEFGIQSLTA